MRRPPLSGVRRFVYDGDRLIAEYSGSGTLRRRYVHGAGVDEPLVWYEGAAVSAANRHYLHADHQGSIVAASTASGAMLQVTANNAYQYAYDTYGVTDSDNTGRFQYTGQAAIPELGLLYYKARFYNPGLGRFMQTDPIGYEDDINLYAYVGNDPINKFDPTGNDAVGLYWRAFWRGVERAEQIGREEIQRRPGGHNDAEDAMRHAEGSRRMASEVDPFIAFLGGWQHELVGTLRDGQPVSEFYMDLNNNREGRRAAAEGRAVDLNSLITSAEGIVSSTLANEATYLKGIAQDLLNGESVTVGRTTVKFNQNTGALESKTERPGSRIVERRQACVDKTRCQ